MIRISDFPRRFAAAAKQRYKLPSSRGLSILSSKDDPYYSNKTNSILYQSQKQKRQHVKFNQTISSGIIRQKSSASTAIGDDLEENNSTSWYTTDRTILEGNVPGQLSDGKLISLALPDLRTVTRQSTLDYLDNIWALHDSLFESL